MLESPHMAVIVSIGPQDVRTPAESDEAGVYAQGKLGFGQQCCNMVHGCSCHMCAPAMC